MSVIVSVIAYTSYINPGAVFQNILLIIFLSSYTMLLFTFSYVFSNLTKIRAQMLSLGFGVAGLVAGSACLLGPLQDSFTVFRVAAFFGLAIFCFGVIVYEQAKRQFLKRGGMWLFSRQQYSFCYSYSLILFTTQALQRYGLRFLWMFSD